MLAVLAMAVVFLPLTGCVNLEKVNNGPWTCKDCGATFKSFGEGLKHSH